MQTVGEYTGLVIEAIDGEGMAASWRGSTNCAMAILTAVSSHSEYVGTLQFMMRETLKGLAHLENKGVVHNDIRPDNIMCDKSGAVKIVDFGIASDKGEVNYGMLPIGHGSVAPEVAKREALDGRSDVFGAGEIARRAVERDGAFDYHRTNTYDWKERKPTSVSFNDVEHFAEPNEDGQSQQALYQRGPERVQSRGPAPHPAVQIDRIKRLLENPFVKNTENETYLHGLSSEAKRLSTELFILADQDDDDDDDDER